ncbi:unnamed protein product [Mytilus coruscus]|uniref:Integrase catalytic domain-containing protein n=1 Tax=Mytilus coruscus TaxID=42192 RepID=A0A6J8EMT7_MYTCO|nr:unnamed protein product [Mytilus coruscus]
MPLMPPLPQKRVNESAPFTYTGVDYFGPIFVKSDTGSKKVWVCLYTCLVVRVIHMELMQDMSAEEFLLGFRRFITRWGSPKPINSDNGSQFKLASNTLEEAWNGVTVDSDVQTYMANEGIQWQFIVELAPWMGGFYERLIGIVKRCLRKTIGKLCLTNEQFRTLLAESEAVVNSRPLVYIGDDINSNIILTPAHFLTLNPKTGFPDHNEADSTDPEYLPQISSAKKLLLTWKKGQKHLTMFWKTWRDEYLLSLRERTANKLRSGRILQKLQLRSWKIDRICQLVVSRDGQIRSGKVMLPNKKTLNRALNMLYPIECEELNEGLTNSDTEKDTELINDNTSTTRERSQRQAARTAMKKIQEQLES